MSLKDKIEDMEILMSPAAFGRLWQIIKERNSKGIDVWYISPKPYRYGFATALSEDTARWEFEKIGRSAMISARRSAARIVWC